MDSVSANDREQLVSRIQKARRQDRTEHQADQEDHDRQREVRVAHPDQRPLVRVHPEAQVAHEAEHDEGLARPGQGEPRAAQDAGEPLPQERIDLKQPDLLPHAEGQDEDHQDERHQHAVGGAGDRLHPLEHGVDREQGNHDRQHPGRGVRQQEDLGEGLHVTERHGVDQHVERGVQQDDGVGCPGPQGAPDRLQGIPVREAAGDPDHRQGNDQRVHAQDEHGDPGFLTGAFQQQPGKRHVLHDELRHNQHRSVESAADPDLHRAWPPCGCGGRGRLSGPLRG